MLEGFTYCITKIIIIIKSFSLLGFISPSSITRATNAPVITFRDWCVWFIIILIIVMFLSKHISFNIFSTIKNWFYKGLSWFKKRAKYIPFGFTALLPFLHKVFGHGSIKEWIFDLIINSYHWFRQSRNSLIYYRVSLLGF